MNLHETIEARIGQLVAANITVFGTNISELLESQRRRIADLVARNKELMDANHRLSEVIDNHAPSQAEPEEQPSVHIETTCEESMPELVQAALKAIRVILDSYSVRSVEERTQ